jgi:Mrr N-terminal domain
LIFIVSYRPWHPSLGVAMSRSIDVDDDVYERLKQDAEPFVDTPNSVLRRLLGLEGASTRPDDRAASAGRGTSAGADSQNRSQSGKRTGRAARARGQKRVRVPAGSILPEEDYELPLLRSLVEAGGSGSSKQVVELVGERLANKLTELDKEALASGGIRWQNRIQFVRLKLIERGLMEREAPRGIWAISEDGRRFVEANQ